MGITLSFSRHRQTRIIKGGCVGDARNLNDSQTHNKSVINFVVWKRIIMIISVSFGPKNIFEHFCRPH